MPLATNDLCERYGRLYTGAVADTLDDMGYSSRALPTEIDPLTDDMHLSGVAYPVLGEADTSVDYDRNIRQILRMIGDVPEHGVLVIQANDDISAHLGELTTTAMAYRGCRGAVIDGGTRDVRHILEQEFPVFARYRTPTDAPRRWRLVDWDIPITIGDIEVRPGDVVLGDLDGVVCIPRNLAESVLEQAEETVDAENAVREAVRGGTEPLEAYERHGKF